MLCEPVLSVEIVSVATPLETAAVPIATPPSLKVTLPVGVPGEPLTVAVNVTAWPKLLGLAEDVTVVVVVGAL
jgi:hypothetical protein